MVNNKRKLVLRSDRRNPPDLRKLSRALIALAQARAEADAMAENEKNQKKEKNANS